jgi:hypothetical protein
LPISRFLLTPLSLLTSSPMTEYFLPSTGYVAPRSSSHRSCHFHYFHPRTNQCRLLKMV